MKKFLSVAVGVVFFLAAYGASKPVTLSSPDGRLSVSVEGFRYSVTIDGRRMVAPSSVSMTLADGSVFGGNARMRGIKRTSGDGIIKAVNYKRSEIVDKYNQMTLRYKDFDLVFRVYDEAVAYRFVAKRKAPFTVLSEEAEFVFPDDWEVYVPYCGKPTKDIQKQLKCSYESYYSHTSLSGWESGRAAYLPLLVGHPEGYKIAITESDVLGYPHLVTCKSPEANAIHGFHARYPSKIRQGGHNRLEGLVEEREDFIARDCEADKAFPWRVLQISRNDAELAGSDVVYKLATPAGDVDWSWVKPGKVAWDWWNDWNLKGVGFKAGINNETYRYYIDFAANHGIEYVILDEGWSVNLVADLMQIVPEIDLKELCSYAASKNVGLILWTGYWAMAKDVEGVFRHYSEMGIKGFKIDFMNRDDQIMVDFYTSCAEAGAKYHMLIDFHGAFKPAGLNRTYPNVLNFEAVKGLENMKWVKSDEQVRYDVTIPFIRQIAGPMDYTQGAMLNATRRQYRPVNDLPMSQGTRCRQLAEYIIFDAPFTMLCDSPTNYLAEPECTEFIAAIPTVWDDTRVLDGKIAQHITMARRSGSVWYVGALTDWDARDIEINLSFLPAGTYRVEIIEDGINADRRADDWARRTITAGNGDTVKAHLAPGGGWIARIVEQ